MLQSLRQAVYTPVQTLHHQLVHLTPNNLSCLTHITMLCHTSTCCAMDTHHHTVTHITYHLLWWPTGWRWQRRRMSCQKLASLPPGRPQWQTESHRLQDRKQEHARTHHIPIHMFGTHKWKWVSQQKLQLTCPCKLCTNNRVLLTMQCCLLTSVHGSSDRRNTSKAQTEQS